MASCLNHILDLFTIFGVCVCEKLATSLILNFESEVIYSTAKEASLPITANGNMYHGLPYGLPRQQEPWTPT